MKKNQCVLLLATGGTIAGKTISQENPDLYKSGQLGAANLLASSQASDGFVRHRDIAQIDSKEMGLPVWQALCRALEEAMQDDAIVGVVITHGTDTMVETAAALAGDVTGKTIVLTGAMIPYAFGSSDGLFNLGSALSFVQVLTPGVYVAMNGRCFPWNGVRKNRSTGIFEAL